MNNPTTLLTTHVFNKTQSLPNGCVLTDISRGITLPDRFRIVNTTQKNPVEPGSLDALSNASLQYTYVNSDGVVKYVQYGLTRRAPDDCPSADDTAAFDLFMSWFFSAKTNEAARVSDFKSGVII